MIFAATSFKYVFDYQPEDVYWCTADIGWITGHSYLTYGPLANGATSVLVSVECLHSRKRDVVLLSCIPALLCDAVQGTVRRVLLSREGMVTARGVVCVWPLAG